MTLSKKATMICDIKAHIEHRFSYGEPHFPHKHKTNERGVSLEKLVVIMDEMQDYANRLARYLNGRRDFPYRAVVMLCPEEVVRYVDENVVYAIVAVERWEPELRVYTTGTEVLLFCLRDKKEGYYPGSIYRYDSAKEIERRIVKRTQRKKEVPIIGFYSPPGGCGMDLLSRKIALELGKEGRVMYLSLFPFDSYGREGKDGLSEALYYIRQPEGDRKEALRELIQCGEFMDSIGPVRWHTDLESITKTDLERLLQATVWEAEYAAFVIGVGQFGKTGKEALSLCDRILVPVWENEEGQRIQEEFRRQLRESRETGIYTAIREFPVKPLSVEWMDAAVVAAVEKGREIVAGDTGGDTQTDVSSFGCGGRIDG